MPVSTPAHISQCVHWICGLAPESVLDVGCGFGLWGFLCREYLDVWHERLRPEDWRVRIDGIELFEPYIQAHQRALYSSIEIADIREVAPTLDRYDLIIAGDVIEHLEKREGEEVLEHLYEKARKALLVNLPLGEGWDHPIAHGNPGELHRSQWAKEDLVQYPAQLASASHGELEYGVFFCTKDCSDDQRIDALATAVEYRDAQGDLGKAAYFLRQILALAPAHRTAVVALADVSIRSGATQDAVSALERAVEADASFHYAYLALARILASLSIAGRAREYLERLLALEGVPEDVLVPAQELLACLCPSPRPAENA